MVANKKSLQFLWYLIILAVIWYLDWITGYELSLGPFYLIPIALASWNFGLPGTLFFAFGAIFSRDFVDLQRPYSHHWLYYWNATMRVAFFLTFALCIRKISSVIAAQRELIKELSDTFEESWRVGGLFPVCMECKNMRTDAEYIRRVRAFLDEHPNARFVHSVCPECVQKTAASKPEPETIPGKIVPQTG
jgi:hypothetical protein